MAAKKSKPTEITADQAEWLEEHLMDIINLSLSPVGATKEIVKELKVPDAVAQILVDRARDVRDANDLADNEGGRVAYEDAVSAYEHLDSRLNAFFAVKGKKRYAFRVGD